MLHLEKKTVIQPPHVNFVWFGTLNESSVEGPISLARAKNDAGQSYQITYWVEEERVLQAREMLSSHGNIQVKSVGTIIHAYCGNDLNKEKKITSLLARCRTEGIMMIAKEILVSIIQSQTDGYYFDTTISAAAITNLPMLTKPAIVRNLRLVKGDSKIDISDESCDLSQYQANRENIENDTASDMYTFFSAANASGEVSVDSKELFSQLAEDTIETWSAFFNKKMEYKLDDRYSFRNLCDFVEKQYASMIIQTLMGPITALYAPHEEQDKTTIILLDKKRDKLIPYDVVTAMPASTVSTCKFTTIDAIPLPTSSDANGRWPLQLFLDGNQCGITKYIGGFWKASFQQYIERQAMMSLGLEVEAKKALIPTIIPVMDVVNRFKRADLKHYESLDYCYEFLQGMREPSVVKYMMKYHKEIITAILCDPWETDKELPYLLSLAWDHTPDELRKDIKLAYWDEVLAPHNITAQRLAQKLIKKLHKLADAITSAVPVLAEETEAKTCIQLPHINFVCFGALKSSSFTGPIWFAEKKNGQGPSYQISYWIEEALVSAAKEVFAEYKNIHVESIDKAISAYCNDNARKAEKINTIIAKCRAEGGLPTIQKAILGPIIQTQTSGYLFETSITAENIAKTLTQHLLDLMLLLKPLPLLDVSKSYHPDDLTWMPLVTSTISKCHFTTMAAAETGVIRPIMRIIALVTQFEEDIFKHKGNHVDQLADCLELLLGMQESATAEYIAKYHAEIITAILGDPWEQNTEISCLLNVTEHSSPDNLMNGLSPSDCRFLTLEEWDKLLVFNHITTQRLAQKLTEKLSKLGIAMLNAIIPNAPVMRSQAEYKEEMQHQNTLAVTTSKHGLFSVIQQPQAQRDKEDDHIRRCTKHEAL
jgi:hypothetical protein